VAATTVAASPAHAVVVRFVELMERQDLAGVVALYDPGSAWEVHVPGWDALLTDRDEMLDLHAAFFGRLEFRIDRFELTAAGDRVALSWDLGWRDRESGLPAASFQSHHFVVRGGRIAHHRMYCAGIRVYGPDADGEEV
jgi:ketosteroid isomerase-like protein